VLALAGATWFVARDTEPSAPTSSRPLVGDVTRDGSVARPASTVVPELPTPLSYSMRVRVDDYAGGERVVNREQLTVRRPFDSERVVIGDEGRTRSVTVFGRWSVPRTGGEAGTAEVATLAIAPAAAASDYRLDPRLIAALPDGYLAAREVREVAGRACRV
jgi:hypothetical protein